MDRPQKTATRTGRAFVLGGNASTLAFVSSVRAEKGQVSAWLVPIAWTPVGVAVGENWQRVSIAADNVGGWVDATFPPEDERAFVTPLRDLEMLIRVGWHAETPEALDVDEILNADDMPEDVLDGFEHEAVPLVQCAVCRRTCVRGAFVWNERQLCAWDFHATVFGKRGPWRETPYEERFFETLPRAAYVAPGLLDEADVDAVLAIGMLPEPTLRRVLNLVVEENPGASYLGVRTDDGLTLLRERTRPTAAD